MNTTDAEALDQLRQRVEFLEAHLHNMAEQYVALQREVVRLGTFHGPPTRNCKSCGRRISPKASECKCGANWSNEDPKAGLPKGG